MSQSAANQPLETMAGRHGGPVRELVRKHPMATFVILACAFAWALIPVFGSPLGSGPFFAAVIVLAMTQGRRGLRDLFSQMTRWRVSWKWYAAAIGLPASAAIVAALVTIGLGAPRPSSAQLGEWTGILPFFAFAMLVPLLGPWEEPGFRGFALNSFLRHRSILVAGLFVGVIHVFWHTPLFFTGDIPLADVVYILAASVVFAWLVTGSGGSVLLAMIMHATSNAVSGEYISTFFNDHDAATLGWIRAGIWGVFALAVVLAGGRRMVVEPGAESGMVGVSP
ncbi:MAG: CPBP family intramembrane glutamic endopeptidase [Acidimicrobiia bacterium]